MPPLDAAILRLRLRLRSLPNGLLSSRDDVAQPASGILTLRSALDQAASGDTINFDTSLNGATIELNLIGVNHSTLLGETYSGMTFQGYAERDYAKSAIYAKKNIELDATSLPNGITIKWTGGDTNPARVLAVYGDLILRNVNITGGYSQAEAISNSTAQPYTLARGGGVAVWGTLTLDHSAIYGNKIVGDTESSRDRGTYGGGIYANGLDLTACIVASNSAKRVWRGRRCRSLRRQRKRYHYFAMCNQRKPRHRPARLRWRNFHSLRWTD